MDHAPEIGSEVDRVRIADDPTHNAAAVRRKTRSLFDHAIPQDLQQRAQQIQEDHVYGQPREE